MDLNELIRQVGLWPALVLIMGWWIDRIRREQLAEKDDRLKDKQHRISVLEEEAHQTVEAKNRELEAKNQLLSEWQRIALDQSRTGR